ncbi:Uncharacterized protein PODLI_1B035374 [Podarcis lilfordi]|uniref:Anterior gradient 2, protein disulphide isomerase family member n=1 Tax=Podarcis lilfordi TaxID=74358 RepID=A0AA35PJW0_9SAUR|nr:Uncharacterized protein PODLI_1B035374 [Podarcis lilfordi]
MVQGSGNLMIMGSRQAGSIKATVQQAQLTPGPQHSNKEECLPTLFALVLFCTWNDELPLLSPALKKVFVDNQEIQEMCQNNFIMLNLMHETTDKNMSPDGQYVPRIMFVDPSLTVRADITGRYSNRLYTYEPQDLPVLIENMKKALRLVQTEL